MEMRKRNGMLDKSCASKNTNVLECWFDSSHAYILISFISAGTLAMLRREQNDTNTKIAATLVCNFKGIKMICMYYEHI
jgi:hypothetical protein